MPSRESRFEALIESCFTRREPQRRELTPREVEHHRWLTQVGALFTLVGVASSGLGAAASVRMAWSWAWSTPGVLMVLASALFVVSGRFEAENRRAGKIAVDDFTIDE